MTRETRIFGAGMVLYLGTEGKIVGFTVVHNSYQLCRAVLEHSTILDKQMFNDIQMFEDGLTNFFISDDAKEKIGSVGYPRW